MGDRTVPEHKRGPMLSPLMSSVTGAHGEKLSGKSLAQMSSHIQVAQSHKRLVEYPVAPAGPRAPRGGGDVADPSPRLRAAQLTSSSSRGSESSHPSIPTLALHKLDASASAPVFTQSTGAPQVIGAWATPRDPDRAALYGPPPPADPSQPMFSPRASPRVTPTGGSAQASPRRLPPMPAGSATHSFQPAVLPGAPAPVVPARAAPAEPVGSLTRAQQEDLFKQAAAQWQSNGTDVPDAKQENSLVELWLNGMLSRLPQRVGGAALLTSGSGGVQRPLGPESSEDTGAAAGPGSQPPAQDPWVTVGEGLSKVGLDREHLTLLGLNGESIDRLYRGLYVHVLSFQHLVNQEACRVVPGAEVSQNTLSGFTELMRIMERMTADGTLTSHLQQESPYGGGQNLDYFFEDMRLLLEAKGNFDIRSKVLQTTIENERQATATQQVLKENALRVIDETKELMEEERQRHAEEIVTWEGKEKVQLQQLQFLKEAMLVLEKKHLAEQSRSSNLSVELQAKDQALAEKIAKLQDNMQELQKVKRELARHEQSAGELADSIKLSEDRAKTNADNLSQMRAKLAQFQEEYKSMEAERDSLTEMWKEAAEERKEAEEKVAQLQRSLMQCEIQVEKRDRVIAAKSDEIEKKDATIAEQQEELEDLRVKKATLGEAEILIKQLQKTVQDLRQQLNIATMERAAEYREGVEVVKELQQATADLEADRAALTEKLKLANAETLREADRHSTAENELEACKAHLGKVSVELENSMNQHAYSVAIGEDFQSKLQGSEDIRVQLKKELDGVKASLADKMRAFNKAAASESELMKNLTETQENAKRQINQMRQTVEEKLEANSTMQQRINELQSQLEELNRQKQVMTSAVERSSSLQNEVGKLVERNGKLERDVADLVSKLRREADVRAATEKENAKLTRQLTEMESRNSQSTSQRDKLDAEMKAAREEIRVLTENKAVLMGEKESLDGQLDGEIQRRGQAEAQVKNLNAQLDALHEELRQLKEKLADAEKLAQIHSKNEEELHMIVEKSMETFQMEREDMDRSMHLLKERLLKLIERISDELTEKTEMTEEMMKIRAEADFLHNLVQKESDARAMTKSLMEDAQQRLDMDLRNTKTALQDMRRRQQAAVVSQMKKKVRDKDDAPAASEKERRRQAVKDIEKDLAESNFAARAAPAPSAPLASSAPVAFISADKISNLKEGKFNAAVQNAHPDVNKYKDRLQETIKIVQKLEVEVDEKEKAEDEVDALRGEKDNLEATIRDRDEKISQMLTEVKELDMQRKVDKVNFDKELSLVQMKLESERNARIMRDKYAEEMADKLNKMKLQLVQNRQAPTRTGGTQTQYCELWAKNMLEREDGEGVHIAWVSRIRDILAAREEARQPVNVVPLKTLRKLIKDLYAEKMQADISAQRQGRDVHTLPEFLYSFIFHKYGLPAPTEQRLCEVAASIRHWAREDREVELFGLSLTILREEDRSDGPPMPVPSPQKSAYGYMVANPGQPAEVLQMTATGAPRSPANTLPSASGGGGGGMSVAESAEADKKKARSGQRPLSLQHVKTAMGVVLNLPSDRAPLPVMKQTNLLGVGMDRMGHALGLNLAELILKVQPRGIDVQSACHPLVKEATALLAHQHGMEKLLALLASDAFYDVVNEVDLGIEVSERQLPQLYLLLLEAAAIMQMDPPRLYIKSSTKVDAYVWKVKGERPAVVLTGALMEVLDPLELQAVIGSRLLMIQEASYAVYSTCHMYMDFIPEQLRMTAGLSQHWDQLYTAVVRWQRYSMLSGDRAALLVAQNVPIVASMTMKMAAAAPALNGAFNVDALLENAKNLDFLASMGRTVESGKLEADPVKLLAVNHSLSVLRVHEMQRWADSTEFNDMLNQTKPMMYILTGKSDRYPSHRDGQTVFSDIG